MIFSVTVPPALKQTARWQAALEIIQTLRQCGFSAYIVGGAVRDVLLGNMPKDLDIASSATPEKILEIFPEALPLGASFGVVVIRKQGYSFETATFREERAYEDGRHPEEVVYTDSPEPDACRRDFTINAMFLDPVEESVLDYTGGLSDLKKGILRTVGDPDRRFHEDYLRILRAVRFASRFRYTLDPAAEEVIRSMPGALKHISSERIRDELEKMLLDPHPADAFRMLADLGLLKTVLPEVDVLRGLEQPVRYHPEGDVFQHTMLMLSHMVWPSRELAWSILLHDVGKKATQSFDAEGIPHFYGHEAVGADMAEKILMRLRLSRQTIKTVSDAVRNHMKFASLDKMKPAKWKRMMAGEHFLMELELHRIDTLCSNRLFHIYLLSLERIRELQRQQQKGLPKPLLTGRDLLSCGIPSGPQIGSLLREAMDMQLEGILENREDALDFIQKRSKHIFNNKNESAKYADSKLRKKAPPTHEHD